MSNVTLGYLSRGRPTVPAAPNRNVASAASLLFRAGAAALLALALAGCGGSESASAPQAAPPAAVAPTITAQPAALAVTEGDGATFSVNASGSAPLSYQWKRGGADIAGATASTYTLAAATLADNGAAFSVSVSNSAGSVTSSAAALTVNARLVPVTITAAPQSLTVAELQTVTLTVTASGSAPLTYQWQRSADGASWTDVAGATADSYTTPQLVRTDSGVRYRVIVNNAANQPAASAPAQLTVTADAAVLLAQGGTVSGDNDGIRLQIAAGVLAGPTRFTFTPRTTFDGLPTGYTLVPGTAYDITWSGAGFVAARQVTFGIRTVAPVVAASTRVRAAADPDRVPTAVTRCPSGVLLGDSSDQGGGYQGRPATLCEGDGTASTQVGLATPPPPPPSTGPWTQVGVPALQRVLNSVAFAGPSVAVALGVDGRYIRSTNAGLSWTEATSPLASNESGRVAFADANVGVIVSSTSSGGTIRRTTDAGANWSFAFNSGRMSAVAFGSSTVGVAVGDQARILRTTVHGRCVRRRQHRGRRGRRGHSALDRWRTDLRRGGHAAWHHADRRLQGGLRLAAGRGRSRLRQPGLLDRRRWPDLDGRHRCGTRLGGRLPRRHLPGRQHCDRCRPKRAELEPRRDPALRRWRPHLDGGRRRHHRGPPQ